MSISFNLLGLVNVAGRVLLGSDQRERGAEYYAKRGLDFETKNRKVLDKRTAKKAKADAKVAKKK